MARTAGVVRADGAAAADAPAALALAQLAPAGWCTASLFDDTVAEVTWPDGQPADRQLADFFRRHPMLGKRDRRLLADRVFDVLRNATLYRAWLDAAGTNAQAGDAEAAAALIGVATRRAGDAGFAAELAAFAATRPPPIRYSLPPWLWQRLAAQQPERAAAIAAALLEPAPLDLRCNLLRGSREALQRLLAERGIDARPVAAVATALRVTGRPALEALDLFEQGWFEIQDAGSQLIAAATGARRGELIVDFCAGAGGKALALAARMRDRGQVLAFDTDALRLDRLAPRAQRAGASIIRAQRIDGSDDPRLARYAGRADCVLVDAPCSGSGTVRRNPDLKWRLDPGRLARHAGNQQAILAAAARLVRPGGRLVYATCSLLDDENDACVAAFGAGPAAGFTLEASRRWLPDRDGSDAFYVATWQYRPAGATSGNIGG
ncbi:MAG: RsmB/NOP family class I SAM-dependent RNA methyltransferase [Lautropia sp.]